MRHCIALAVLALTACTPVAIAPPIRMVPQETSEIVGADRTGVAGSFGGHETGFFSGTARVRRALIPEHLELSVEGSGMYFQILEDNRPANEWAGTGRIGVKHRVVPHLAFTGGIGGGMGPWGGFVGTDLGVIIAYENPDIVPFIGLRSQFSVPVGVEPEHVPEMDEMGRSFTRTVEPHPTAYFQPSIGLRLPLCHDDCDGMQVALSIAASFSLVYVLPPVDISLGVFGGEGGLEIEL